MPYVQPLPPDPYELARRPPASSPPAIAAEVAPALPPGTDVHPQVRAGQEDRDKAILHVTEAHALGYLPDDVAEMRLRVAKATYSVPELKELVSDLPKLDGKKEKEREKETTSSGETLSTLALRADAIVEHLKNTNRKITIIRIAMMLYAGAMAMAAAWGLGLGGKVSFSGTLEIMMYASLTLVVLCLFIRRQY